MDTHIKKNKGFDTGRRLLSAFFILSAIAIFSWQIVLSAQFSRQVKGHLKLAADANTIELAE